jgi:6,7-dimethyl-8-ribityllumazine synthase
MTAPKPILIVEARFYEKIADWLFDGASKVIAGSNHGVERISVPGVFEIPAAVKFGWNTGKYDGVVSLGCVIRGQTDHYDHICREVSRALMDLSIHGAMPHGFGILTCENGDQAYERADVTKRDLGGKAAKACLAMIDIRARTGARS